VPQETANERTFVVSDHPDLATFKVAYSRAYAVSLRKHFGLDIVGQPTPEQEAVMRQVAAGRDSDTKRGERSVIQEVKVRGDACRLKRHFGTGCMRQIIGWAEKLASQDPERFIWIKNWKTAKRGRDGDGGTYGKTQRKRCLWVLEGCGILTPAIRVRGGATRTGWIVARHDDVSVIDNGRCRLMAVPRGYTISPRTQGQNLKRYLDVETRGTLNPSSNAVHVENRGTIKGTLIEPPRDFQRDFPRDFESSAKGLSIGGNHLGQKELEGRVENTVRANPVNPVIPVISNPVSPAKDLTLAFGGSKSTEVQDNSNSNGMTSFASHDHDHDPDSLSSRQRNYDDYPAAGTDLDPIASSQPTESVGMLERVVEKISGGKFDTAYLAQYEHQQKLLECCQYAAEWISHDIERRRDPAGIMAYAMESMRQMYGFDVPKGWVPVMRELRADAKVRREKRQLTGKQGDFAHTGSMAGLFATAATFAPDDGDI
jgi:hypothetical protein